MKKIFVFIVFSGSNNEQNQDLIKFEDDKLTGELALIDKNQCEIVEFMRFDATMQIYKESADVFNQSTKEILTGNFKLIDHKMIKGILLTKNSETIFVVLNRDYSKLKICEMVSFFQENFES